MNKYTLCLDTDKYAGNFERETTAYATGVVGECGVGNHVAKEFHAMGIDVNILEEIEDKVLLVGDEVCERPCGAVATPGWVNDGMGTQYRQSETIPPTPEQTEAYRKTWRDYSIPHLNQARYNTAKGIADWTPEALAREEQRYLDIETKTIMWSPQYNSVGIFFNERPSDDVIKLIVTRAKEFLTRTGVTLEGVRIMVESTVVTVTEEILPL